MGMVPDNDGTLATFASFRENAWHGLGTVFTEPITDYRQMLVKANMANQNPHFREVTVEGVTDVNKRMLAVVRTSPFTGEPQVIGYVGERYEIVTNEEAFAFTQHLRKGSTWETAGEMNGGATVFGSMALSRSITLDPNGASDKVDLYGIVAASHDGSTGVMVCNTGVRPVCKNTLDIAIRGGVQKVKFRHTKNVQERMAQALKVQAEQDNYFDLFEKTANSLYAITLTKPKFFDLVVSIYPRPEEGKKAALTKWEKNVETVMACWSGPTNDMLPENGWRAVQAITEENQWNRQVRAGNVENFFAAGAGFDGPTSAFRTDVVNRVLALA